MFKYKHTFICVFAFFMCFTKRVSDFDGLWCMRVVSFAAARCQTLQKWRYVGKRRTRKSTSIGNKGAKKTNRNPFFVKAGEAVHPANIHTLLPITTTHSRGCSVGSDGVYSSNQKNQRERGKGKQLSTHRKHVHVRGGHGAECKSLVWARRSGQRRKGSALVSPSLALSCKTTDLSVDERRRERGGTQGGEALVTKAGG